MTSAAGISPCASWVNGTTTSFMDTRSRALAAFVSVVLALLAACATETSARRRTTRRTRRSRAAASVTAVTPPAQSGGAPSADSSAASPSALTTRTPPVRATVSAPDDPRCAAYVRRNEGALDAIGEASGACHAAVVDALRESFTRCASARGGSWIPEITAVETAPEGARGDHCALTVRWRLVALTYDAPVEETPARGRRNTGRVARDFRVLASGREVQEISRLELVASEFSTDGHPDVIVTVTAQDATRTPDTRRVTEVYSAASGDVDVLAVAQGMEILDVTDVDQDGRADLVIPGPYVRESRGCATVTQHHPIPALAHALAGGQFALDDEVVARHLRAACPNADGRPADRVGDPLDQATRAVVCRRLWGQSPEAALAAARCDELPARDEPTGCLDAMRAPIPVATGDCPAWLERIARTPPLVNLR